MDKKRKKGGLKKFFNDFWYLLWKDDSFKGWIFSVVFLFLFIRFIFFPVLMFATGTAIPLAIVESCSMYHRGGMFSDLDSWWDNRKDLYKEFDISKEGFNEFPLKKGFNKGDILFVIGVNPEKLEVGDVIIFEAGEEYPVIHRIVEIKEINEQKIYSTLGDNNMGQSNFEKEIPENKLIGKAVFRIAPYIGWVKLMFYEFRKDPSQRGFC